MGVFRAFLGPPGRLHGARLTHGLLVGPDGLRAAIFWLKSSTIGFGLRGSTCGRLRAADGLLFGLDGHGVAFSS